MAKLTTLLMSGSQVRVLSGGQKNKEMNLTIKAKSIQYDEWVEGYYFEYEGPLQCFGTDKDKSKYFIYKTGFADWNIPRLVNKIEINQETICRNTGLLKKINNKRTINIFENDLFFEEIEEEGGDVRLFFIVTWIQEKASFALLTLGETFLYENQGLEGIIENFESFRFEVDQESIDKLHYKGSRFDNVEFLENEL